MRLANDISRMQLTWSSMSTGARLPDMFMYVCMVFVCMYLRM